MQAMSSSRWNAAKPKPLLPVPEPAHPTLTFSAPERPSSAARRSPQSPGPQKGTRCIGPNGHGWPSPVESSSPSSLGFSSHPTFAPWVANRHPVHFTPERGRPRPPPLQLDEVSGPKDLLLVPYKLVLLVRFFALILIPWSWPGRRPAKDTSSPQT